MLDESFADFIIILNFVSIWLNKDDSRGRFFKANGERKIGYK
jgi:hypothetical protein